MRIRPAGFDSASAAVDAVAAALQGRERPALGKGWAPMARPLGVSANHLPRSVREDIYAVLSGAEGLPPRLVRRARWVDLSAHVAGRYPQRPYEGAVIGSAPGAVVNLCTALGMPFLPQTQLLAVRRRGVGADDPRREIDVLGPSAQAVVDGDPNLVVHHMMDPNQDRLTLRRFGYFRVKATRLGPAYERFLRRSVRPGGTLILLECRQTWPATRLADRYFFQFGGVGGMTLDEFFHGGPRVRAFLGEYGAAVRRWDPPQPDGVVPEAEWGFSPALADDVARFAAENGFRLLRLAFRDVNALSPLVADVHRDWYRKCGRRGERLFAQSFVLTAPRLIWRAGVVPYWLTFSDRDSLAALTRYVETAQPRYRDIDMTLMAHGTDSVGVSGPADWDRVFRAATRRGRLAGVDPARFPADFGVYFRYRDQLATLPERPCPPLDLDWFAEFAGSHAIRYAVDVSASEPPGPDRRLSPEPQPG